MDNSIRSIRGSVALVTGAASGIGAATARLFAQEGAKIAVTDRDKRGVEAVVSDITDGGGTAYGWHLDVADHGAVGHVVDDVAARFGGIDLIVNNAGISNFLALEKDGYDELWDRMLLINLTSQQRIVRAALPWLRKATAPRVVNIASTEGLGAAPGASAYVVSKTGVVGLTRALAVELGPDGILVNCICPGPTETPLYLAAFGGDEKTAAAFVRRRTALRRHAKPEEIAHMALSLCLPAASFVTGAVIPVDGGLTIRND